MDYRWLPKVDRIVLALDALPSEVLEPGYSRKIMTEAARCTVDSFREQIASGEGAYADKEQMFAAAVAATLACYRRLCTPSLRPVINATGVVLHTNLGRAVLAPEAVAAIHTIAGGYCNLELDLDSGKRSSRYDHVVKLLRELTGAEDALVVNNNAGAVLLVLDALGRGGEAIVSRGQLVEIGGSFRVPDIMERSGVRLREVGTTNKTHLMDYANAINEETKLLLRVHPSNFKLYGFTESVSLADMVELGHAHGLPVMDDLGSGCLYPLAAQGIGEEPVVSEAMQSGVDVLTFSGDKLLGGPQAGIIVGKAEYISRIKTNPLTRALRVDKFTLAALEATLRIYSQGREAEEIPTLTMITAGRDQIRPKAQQLAERLTIQAEGSLLYQVRVLDALSEVGGGSLPGVELPTVLVEVMPSRIKSAELLQRLRQGDPAAMGYIREDRALFDLRTVAEQEIPVLADLICRYCREA